MPKPIYAINPVQVSAPRELLKKLRPCPDKRHALDNEPFRQRRSVKGFYAQLPGNQFASGFVSFHAETIITQPCARSTRLDNSSCARPWYGAILSPVVLGSVRVQVWSPFSRRRGASARSRTIPQARAACEKPLKSNGFLRKVRAVLVHRLTTDQKVVGSTPTGCATYVRRPVDMNP